MLKLVAGLMAVPVAVGTAVVAPGVLMVDVKEGGARGHHLVLPVPLLAAHAAAAIVPAERTRIPIDGEARKYLPVAREVLASLAKAPDCELVRVEEHDELVVVSKHGDHLEVEVDDHGEHVSVKLPLSLALEAMPDDEGRVSVTNIVGALQAARFTKLVDVDSKSGERVSVTLW